jgi:hypothetical protein
MTFADLLHKFFLFVWDNKQKLSATAMAVLSVLQLSPDLAELMEPQTYKVTMLVISVLMVVFASIGGSTPVDRVPPSLRIPSVLVMVGAGVLAALMLGGCASTRGAYKEAQSPNEYAYVVAEHYSVLVNEAADFAALATTPESVKAALKAADARAKPLVLKLRGLAATYVAAKTADNQEALQTALNAAVLAVADFIRTLRAAQGSPTGAAWEPPSDQILALAGGVA